MCLRTRQARRAIQCLLHSARRVTEHLSQRDVIPAADTSATQWNTLTTEPLTSRLTTTAASTTTAAAASGYSSQTDRQSPPIGPALPSPGGTPTTNQNPTSRLHTCVVFKAGGEVLAHLRLCAPPKIASLGKTRHTLC